MFSNKLLSPEQTHNSWDHVMFAFSFRRHEAFSFGQLKMTLQFAIRSWITHIPMQIYFSRRSWPLQEPCTNKQSVHKESTYLRRKTSSVLISLSLCLSRESNAIIAFASGGHYSICESLGESKGKSWQTMGEHNKEKSADQSVRICNQAICPLKQRCLMTCVLLYRSANFSFIVIKQRKFLQKKLSTRISGATCDHRGCSEAQQCDSHTVVKLQLSCTTAGS